MSTGTPAPLDECLPTQSLQTRLLLRLYPTVWRERYGAELIGIIERTREDSGGALGLADVFDLVRGAMDAQCHLADLVGPAPREMSRMRSSIATILGAWMTLCVATGVLAKCLEDGDGGRAAVRLYLPADSMLHASHYLAYAALLIATLSIIAGGAPFAACALRQAWQRRDRVLSVLLCVPLCVVGAGSAYVWLVQAIADPATPARHSTVNLVLFAGLVLLVVAGAIGVVAAACATLYRVELSKTVLAWMSCVSVVTAGAITMGTIGVVMYGVLLRLTDPVLFTSARGLLETPLRANYVAISALALGAAVSADRCAIRGMRALRGDRRRSV